MVTATHPATRPRRAPAHARDLPAAEWARLMREPSYPRPLPPPVPLHVLGRRRELPELRRLAETPPEPPGQDHDAT